MLDCTVGFFVVVGTSAPVRRRIGAPTADAKRLDCGLGVFGFLPLFYCHNHGH